MFIDHFYFKLLLKQKIVHGPGPLHGVHGPGPDKCSMDQSKMGGPCFVLTSRQIQYTWGDGHTWIR